MRIQSTLELATAVLAASVTACVQPETGSGQQSDQKTFTFDHAEPGTAPAGWISDVTGSKQGTPPRWEVKKVEGRHVLAQLQSGGAGGDFPVCLKRESSFKDGAVRVDLKPISGETDQAGGVVFRAQDKDNFYVARANALEDNVSIYCTRNGKRRTIKYWENIEVKLGQWHTLEVQAKGFHFKVFLNKQLVGEIEDPEHVFAEAGMVGVWTKADSVTYFRDVAIATR